ncbi:MAG: ADOP family duplicated permease, partial [Opitutaceae bacterium]
YALVLKPLPFPDANRLVTINNVAEKSGGAISQSALGQYLDFTAQADRFERFALVQFANYTIGEESTPVRAAGQEVTADFFPLFGVAPLLGRFFATAEAAEGNDRVLVLTQSFWEKRYQADRDIVGRPIRMGGENFTIVGVAPRSLEALYLRTDFFKPLARPAQTDLQERFGGRAILIGRLKPDVSMQTGLLQLKSLEQRFHDDVASPRVRTYLDAGGFRVNIAPLRNESTAEVRKSLWLLEAAAVIVLLIGAVNAINLLLARANAKRAELAIRYALGAGRGALMRPMLAESLLLTLMAAAAGIGIAWGALRVINRYLPLVARSAPAVSLDPGVVATILVAALAIGVVIGLLPFVLLWHTGLRTGNARTASASRAVRALSGSLIVAQVAVAFVLLIGAGLLLRSFANVIAVHPGFDAAHTVQARIALPKAYDQPAENTGVRRRILAAVEEIPGVESAAVAAYFGVGPASSFRPLPFTLRGAAKLPEGGQPLVIINPVSAGFFATMGIRLVEGRLFNEGDAFDPTGSPGVIVERGFAQRYFAGRSALGEEFAFGTGPFPPDFKWARIVGVVERANLVGLEQRDGLPFVYLPLGQQPSPGFNVLLRSTRPTGDLFSAIREKLRAIDPALPLYSESTLQVTIDGMLLGRRGIMLLLAVFAGLALLLAGIGLYGVLAYDVSQRTREIGIRGAMGASHGQIVTLVLQQGLWKTGLGLAVGLASALVLTRYLRALLFDVTSTDPISFLGVPAVLLAVATLASWLPARRAAKIDPMVALRSE